jgi:hypothetical protein
VYVQFLCWGNLCFSDCQHILYAKFWCCVGNINPFSACHHIPCANCWNVRDFKVILFCLPAHSLHQTAVMCRGTKNLPIGNNSRNNTVILKALFCVTLIFKNLNMKSWFNWKIIMIWPYYELHIYPMKP